MADPVIKVLDTTVADTGLTQTCDAGFLKKNKPLRFTIDIGAGDTVVIESKSLAAEDFEVIATMVDETPIDVYPGMIWRARRTVDGGSADSEVFVENVFNLSLTEHA